MKHFGNTIRETINAFKKDIRLDNELVTVNGVNKNEKNPDRVHASGRIAVTIILILLALFMFIHSDGKYSEGAYTIIGAITGYWLK